MMASTIASSSTAPSISSSYSSPLEESRPQAGPLPVKRGEIGYHEEVLGDAEDSLVSTSAPVTLPDRHPADRDHPPAASNTANTNNGASSSSTLSTPATTNSSANTPSTNSSSNSDSSSTNSIEEQKRFFKFLHQKKTVTYGGVRVTTLLAFTLQLFVVAGTIAGWVVAALMLSRGKNQGTQQDGNGDSPNMAQASISSSIFIHVVFAIAFLGQLLFLERRIFIIRAQRYAYLHPGEILPTTRRRGISGTNIGIAPWNRPPLPTYAAALAQSGVGTGDVEDNMIAVVPPPAYGNTRGSRLLLTGFLRDSLRAQRPVSVHTEAGSRPVSYASRDEDWEVIQNADRALRLEQTLATLERPQPTRQRM